MAVNVLHTTLLLFQQRLVWHSLLSFFILFQFVYLYSFFVRINRAHTRIPCAFGAMIRKIIRTPPTLHQHINNKHFCSESHLFIKHKLQTT